jgi:hypothetical protein
MLQKLKKLLEYLENNIDVGIIQQRENLHQKALNFQEIDRLPVIASYPYPDYEKFRPFPHGEVFDNPEKMLFNQFVQTFDQSPFLSLQIGDDLPFSIRADFGCVLVASMFGATIEQKDNNPPWVRNADSQVSYDEILNTSLKDFQRGIIPRVVDRYKMFVDILKEYPALESATNITLPDLQGPFDNLELLRGSDIFVEMYSQKQAFLKAMEMMTNAQIGLVRYLSKFISEKVGGISHQHGFAIKGGILIRNDTSIMISPQMYRQMISLYDERILDIFGGGIHSCGKVGSIIEEFLNVNSIACFDFGQSELNEIDKVYSLANEKKIALVRVAVEEDHLMSGNIINKYPTGISMIFRAKSFEHARYVIGTYRKKLQQNYI